MPVAAVVFVYIVHNNLHVQRLKLKDIFAVTRSVYVINLHDILMRKKNISLSWRRGINITNVFLKTSGYLGTRFCHLSCWNLKICGCSNCSCDILPLLTAVCILSCNVVRGVSESH